MSGKLRFEYHVPGDDFTIAGEASSDIKNKLKQMGVDPTAVRKAAIAMYEGEINMVIHAKGGSADVTVDEDAITIVLDDNGPGIADVALAMKEGYSTASDRVRQLGFGAGMGLPNMKRYTDSMQIDSTVGIGTRITMRVLLG